MRFTLRWRFRSTLPPRRFPFQRIVISPGGCLGFSRIFRGQSSSSARNEPGTSFLSPPREPILSLPPPPSFRPLSPRSPIPVPAILPGLNETTSTRRFFSRLSTPFLSTAPLVASVDEGLPGVLINNPDLPNYSPCHSSDFSDALPPLPFHGRLRILGPHTTHKPSQKPFSQTLIGFFGVRVVFFCPENHPSRDPSFQINTGELLSLFQHTPRWRGETAPPPRKVLLDRGVTCCFHCLQASPPALSFLYLHFPNFLIFFETVRFFSDAAASRLRLD